ncbi:MAG: DUF2889 domain-containing protein [Bacillota bacterium]
MELIYNRNWFMTVRDRQGTMLVEASYIGTDEEKLGRMIVRSKDFIVQDAEIEIYRGRDGSKASKFKMPQLVGIEAYFSGGAQVRQAVGDDPLGTTTDLFMEGIRAVIQSEAFIPEERGFTSAEDYNEYFNKTFANTCMFYSHLGEVGNFTEYAELQQRFGNLFNRHRSCSVFREGNRVIIAASICDSFHEMRATFAVNADKTIHHAQAQMIRFPDPVCKGAEVNFSRLSGIPLVLESKRELVGIITGSSGCTHLGDLTYEATRALQLSGALDEK